jgi:hypothetical protein
VFLFLYSDCTHYVDPHTIITMFLYVLVVFYILLYRWIGICMCSILAVDIVIILFASLFWITIGYSPLI